MYCNISNRAYHDAEGEASDDGVFDGDGGEIECADMAREDLSDGAERVLAYGGEDGGAGEVPELFRFSKEPSVEIDRTCDGRDVRGIGDKCSSRGSVSCYRKRL